MEIVVEQSDLLEHRAAKKTSVDARIAEQAFGQPDTMWMIEYEPNGAVIRSVVLIDDGVADKNVGARVGRKCGADLQQRVVGVAVVNVQERDDVADCARPTPLFIASCEPRSGSEIIVRCEYRCSKVSVASVDAPSTTMCSNSDSLAAERFRSHRQCSARRSGKA